jgi:hypothetical protein
MANVVAVIGISHPGSREAHFESGSKRVRYVLPLDAAAVLHE